GMVLMFVFTLGLGLPFIVAGLAYTTMARTVGFVRRHQVWVLRFGGFFMVIVGLLLVTGLWDRLMAMLRQFAAGFVPVI
ncbi:MAG TPA: cytochrome c biogenesis protein CcdA, partial [Microlunatus sp.]|nr:cytochrome c biogenesis protein CcdA [Microlunatus sp.]